jgi:hypothetical protein
MRWQKCCQWPVIKTTMKWEPHYDEMTEVFTMAHDQEVLPMARDQDNNEQSPGNFQSY